MSARALCPRCQRPLPSCYCAHVPHLHNHWPVRILQHPQESRHALGTARIASLGLNDCLLGTGKSPEPILSSLQGCVLIYPGEGSAPLSQLQSGPVRPLLFLDATWRKSQRMLLESGSLAALPRYHLENPAQPLPHSPRATRRRGLDAGSHRADSGDSGRSARPLRRAAGGHGHAGGRTDPAHGPGGVPQTLFQRRDRIAAIPPPISRIRIGRMLRPKPRPRRAGSLM